MGALFCFFIIIYFSDFLNWAYIALPIWGEKVTVKNKNKTKLNTIVPFLATPSVPKSESVLSLVKLCRPRSVGEQQQAGETTVENLQVKNEMPKFNLGLFFLFFFGEGVERIEA